MSVQRQAAGSLSILLSRLTFSVGDAVAIGPIDLEIPAGSTVGVVGETGSGKSLLCRAMVGMLELAGGRIDSGTLEVGGQDYSHATRQEWTRLRRHRVGYMPQASMSGLNPVRRIGGQLTELIDGDRMSRRGRARELLEHVQLRDPARVMRSYPHELSGGMRQRVMLAFALLGDPGVLVADEPTTALDATVQSEVLSLIKRVQVERGMTVVIVSHDMRVIRRMCDSVAVMYGGKILESGPIDDVVLRPQHPYTQALLLADPALAVRKSMLGTVDVAGAWAGGGGGFTETTELAVPTTGANGER